MKKRVWYELEFLGVSKSNCDVYNVTAHVETKGWLLSKKKVTTDQRIARVPHSDNQYKHAFSFYWEDTGVPLNYTEKELFMDAHRALTYKDDHIVSSTQLLTE